ncbi:MAG: YlbF family regulator [Bacilli bacterium]|nr:YlbF family regulator [Bacilli bacterium]
MNDIMKKTYELIDVLEESELINEISRCRDKISKNHDLSELIRKGNSTNDEYMLLDIKRRLYKNKDYKSYMDKYNELMYIVMDINYRYNKLLGKGSCHK